MKFTRQFSKGIMNKDVDDRLVPDGYITDGLNIDIINSEGSDAGKVRNIKGNSESVDLGNLAGRPVVNGRTIGVTKSERDNVIYWFVSTDNFDGVYEFDEDTGDSNIVLQSTTGQLNFSKDYLIQANFLDGFLYWTDDLNPPRRVEVSLVKQWGEDDDKIDKYINVIVNPPIRCPFIELKNDGTQENYIEDRFLQFFYRWKYKHNQYSAMSPSSATAFMAGTYSLDYAAGNNEAMKNLNNKVVVTFETGNEFVEEIQLIVRDTKKGNVYVVDRFNKSTLNLGNYDTHSYEFKNNKNYAPLDESQVTRLFDNVPLKAKAQEIIDRRLIYGNYTQFYDIKDCDGRDLDIDFNLSLSSEEILGEVGTQTFRSDRDYEVGLIYGDDAGRFSTVITPPTDENTLYIDSGQSDKANSLSLEINHLAPCFATNYRLVIKESKKEYYNVFPILYYQEGAYRWLLINESDGFKVNVGDYIIFKSDGDGPTYTNKDFKILEVSPKEKNFLENNGTQVGGLYLKIKVDEGDLPVTSLTVKSWSTQGAGVAGNDYPEQFVLNMSQCVETPIFDGSGVDDFQVSGTYTGDRDIRFTVEIQEDGLNFRYTSDLELGNWTEDNLISAGATNMTSPYNPIVLVGEFANTNNTHTPGDKWTVVVRGSATQFSTPYGGRWTSVENTAFVVDTYHNNSYRDIPYAIVPSSNYNSDLQINAGAIIEIEVTEEWYLEGEQIATGTYTSNPSPSTYKNIEEWWYRSGERNSFVINALSSIDKNDISFRRGSDYQSDNGNGDKSSNYIDQSYGCSDPVRMFIKGAVAKSKGQGFNKEQSVIKATLKVSQFNNPLIAETKSKDALDVFYEIPHTFPINNRAHKVMWEFEDYTDVSTVWSNEPWAPNYPNKTNIGLADPTGNPTVDNIPHYYHAGDSIYVNFPASSPLADGTYEILYVPDSYNVIIDLAHSSGPPAAGYSSLSDVEQDQSESNPVGQPARIKINHPSNPNCAYNAFSFGNGLESDRVLDDYNETTLEYSVRATNTVDIYEQERKESSLCYSGVYKADTSVNNLNEFNLSKANFKDLDIEFGSIQKLHARDTDLMVFQENKVGRVLYGKNLLSDAVGGGSISSIPEVLGIQIPITGEFGISYNPESFSEWGNTVYWADERRGAVLSSNGESVIDISKSGMKDHFRDLFKDNPKTQHLGAFDPYRHQYILASNDQTATACSLSIKPTAEDYPATPSGVSTPNDKPDFIIFSNTSWTTSIVYGSGSGWVTNFPASGFGNYSVHLAVADNFSGAVRTATITITYCDGETATFDISQASGNTITVRPIISYNGNITKF